MRKLLQFGSIAVLVGASCTATPGTLVVESVPSPSPAPVSDTVGPDACFGVRTGAVVVTYDAGATPPKVLGVDTSSDELSSVGRCLSAYVVAHPPKGAARVLFRHAKDQAPELIVPAPDGRASDLVP